MRRVLVAALLVALMCCRPTGGGETTGAGGWEGTVVEEGPVTTVRTVSGSVWGGTAKLVAEASIGVAEGEDEYLLGRIGGIWATDSEILVLDTQVPSVRAYDYEGTYLRQVGNVGQGPGEYGNPQFLAGDAQGRILVADYDTRRIVVFSDEGDYVEAWPMGSVQCCIEPMVVTADGAAYLQMTAWDPVRGGAMHVLQGHGPEGPFGATLDVPDLELPDHTFIFKDRRVDAAFAPTITWALGRSGEIIGGASHEYRFTVRRLDGTTTRIERAYEPVPIQDDEREWRRRYYMAIFRRGSPGWTWDGAEMPATKPAYTRFIPTLDGKVWVVRPGPGRQLPECDPAADIDDHSAFQAASCWRDTEIVDVFDTDGRYLGEVAVPDNVNLRFAFPWIKGDTVIANVYDEMDTIKVVRYRLVVPSTEK